jgi:hypothetical protein
MAETELHIGEENEENDANPQTRGPSPAGSTESSADAKKARVENIVSVMRSSPVLGQALNAPVNGCKKRKLYQPQQHSGDEDCGKATVPKLTRTGSALVAEDTPDDSSQDEVEQCEKNKSESNVLREKLSMPFPISTPETNRIPGSPEPG